MPMFATQLVNKVKMERIIVFMRKECFSAMSFKVLWEFLMEAKTSVFDIERRL